MAEGAPTLRVSRAEVSWECGWAETLHGPGGPRAVAVVSKGGHTLPGQIALCLPGTRQQDGRNMPQRMTRGLLGKEIVNVLVPFTKPQPKKSDAQDPGRKGADPLWLG